VDKILALTGQTPAVQIANIVLPIEEGTRRASATSRHTDAIAQTRNSDLGQITSARQRYEFFSRIFFFPAVADRRVIRI
jgi:hypothetical protein